MSDFIESFFSADGFMPHGHCYLWNPGLVWLHVVSDSLVALAYTSIPFTLLYFARRRRDLPFNWMFLCFGMFIIACGATHVMEVWTLWVPVYWLAGAVKAVTALASVPTAILLARLVPKALAIPSKRQLEEAHAQLRRANEELESRVQQRTQELTRRNHELAKEIADRMRVEDALRKSESRFKRLAESGVIGIAAADIDGTFLDANTTFLEMVGYNRDEVTAGRMHWTDMTPPEWRAQDQRAVDQLETTGVAPVWEKEYIRKDGQRVPVLVGVAMVDNATRECVSFIVDLTARKRAEAAERESEARKTAVMEAALDAIVLMDHHGNITEFNASAERTFGYQRDEVIGKSLADILIPPAFRKEHQAALRRYVETGEHSILGKRIEVTAVRHDGQEFPAEVAIVRIHADGPPLFTGYIRDITERRQAAEADALRRAKDAAEEANTELESFSYSVAHDLRAPLRAINGFSVALLEDYGNTLDPEAKQHLLRIGSAAQRMSELIDALLALARFTRTEPRRESVDLTKLAHEVIDELRAREPGRHVEFVVPDGLTVQGDPQLLHVLLENLLGNAWKFTGKTREARVELGAESVGGTTVYYVRDNGAGFDADHVGKLFAPFRRLHTSEQFEGTGIGLATVKRIVSRHGGDVWAEGAVNMGATFHFLLSGDAELRGQSWQPAR